MEDATNELLALLGFKLWQGYGRIERPKQSIHGEAVYVSRDRFGLSELRPD